ncbi:MAG: hypothetical protein U0746_06040 [Gemmataceae bacterium]
MSPWAYLLAAGLLTTPPDVPEPTIDADEWPAVQEALQSLAVEWEILDERERRYVLARVEDYENDLNLLRRRYQELKDAPRLSDCHRFPERGTVNELLAFNRSYRRYLDGRQNVEQDRCFQLRIALRETDFLYQVWDSVRDARCEYYYITVRRQALKRLRCMVGPEAYLNGDLPPYVPVWRFQDAN